MNPAVTSDSGSGDESETAAEGAADSASSDDRSRPRTSRRTFLTGAAAGAAAGAVAGGIPIVILAGRSDTAADPAAAAAEPTTTSGSPRPASEPAAAAAEPSATTSTARALTPAEQRRAASLEVRERAARMSYDMAMPAHEPNGDERADIGYAFSFTKGLPHDYDTGLVARPEDYEQFVAAAQSGAAQDFIDTPLGPDDGFRTAANDAPRRGWESQGVGLSFDLIGADMQSLTMPPAPAVGSHELTGELAEVYAQALLRDEQLSNLRFDGSTTAVQENILVSLSDLEWFDDSTPLSGLSAAARQRRRTIMNPQTVFRGRARGDTIGPYISQLLLAGSPLLDAGRTAADGLVAYGAQTINQRVRQAAPVDFLTSWDEWFDVQNALAPSPNQLFEGPDRFITTGRDLASYVEDDALYQAYFTACLVLFAHGVSLDRGMPFADDDADDHQQGFVLFAPNHVLSLLGEVSMRALKTVKYQKFNVHRRLRPEELAARVERAELLDIAELTTMALTLDASPLAVDVRASNDTASGTPSMLLPMAYAEGSPMHPSYGAGHATVAGACATVMKALFDHTQPLAVSGSATNAFVANRDGSALELVRVLDETGQPGELTVEGEINKLASNISIARSWAGVHYFSDYWESMLLGEAIAIEILREHMVTTAIDFTLSIPTFEGSTITLTP